MNIPLDANILTRTAQPGHAHHLVATDAVNALVLRGDTPCLYPQALYEFCVVATRPIALSGLGFTVNQASAAELSRLKGLFRYYQIRQPSTPNGSDLSPSTRSGGRMPMMQGSSLR